MNKFTAITISFTAFTLLGVGCASQLSQTNGTSSPAPVAKEPECSAPPVTTEIGRKQYPVADRYAHLRWLGQIFTADDCGAARLAEVAGGPDEPYRYGSKLYITQASAARDAALRNIGYACSAHPANPGGTLCTLDREVRVSTLLKLKPYAQTIDADDCVNCG